MSQHPIQLAEELTIIAGAPVLSVVNYPVIDIKDRLILVELDDANDAKVVLKFQPYQALKLTTRDCYVQENRKVRVKNNLLYQSTSAWLEELKSALHAKDESANFMDKALHFIIPAGDDVLEVVAWKVEITYAGKTTVFPEGVTTFPF